MADAPTPGFPALADAVRPQSPGLAAALGGPGAGIALAALGRSLLQDAQATADEVLAAVKGGDAAAQNAVVAAEQMCQLRLRESGSGLAALAPDVAKALISASVETAHQGFADTRDARARQLATQDRANEVLAYAVSAGFFLLLIVLLFFGDKVAPTFKELLYTLLGVVGTGWANIIGFYFGSSAGSAQKTQAMVAAMTTRQPPPSN